MKIKNVFLASLLTKLGHEVKAELVIDDSNGVSLTFPDISDIAEIAEGVAVDAPDGTYVIADGDAAMTVVVASGAVMSVTKDEPMAAVPELGAEVEATLEAIVEAHTELKSQFVALQKDHNELKATLKHDVEKPGAAAASTEPTTKYKIVG
jgi:hypothetical protein